MLKGKTEIILTDVNSGKEEHTEDTNMVTNAIQDILGTTISGENFSTSIFPLTTKGLAGVFLLDNVLDEDPKHYILSADINMIGRGGNITDSNQSKKRGSYNANESAELDNGFKYVWDFGTHQANGEIKSICLTHVDAGNVGFGDEDIGVNVLSAMSSNSSMISLRKEIISMNRAYDVTSSGSDIKISVYQIPIFSVGIKNNYFLYERIVSLDSMFTVYSGTYDNGFIYILGNLTGTGNVIIKLKSDSFSLINTEFVANNSFSTYSDLYVDGDIFWIYPNNNNYQTKVFIGNINHPSDGTYVSTGTQYGCMGVFNHRLFCSHATVGGDGSALKTTDNARSNNILHNLYNNLFYQYSTSVALNKCYLATINNLSTPINKTADKTMKVIYTITEA